MHSSFKKAVVIGSGVAGLAAAIRLAHKGYKVSVLEANAFPGGKLSEISKEGFRFDAGPSFFTMPGYVDELFELCGKKPETYYSYKKLDLLVRYWYEDGTRLDAHSDLEQFAGEIETKTGVKKEKVYLYFKKSATIYHLTNEVFLQRSLHILKNYFSYATLRGLLRFHQIDAFSTMNAVNEKLFGDPRIVQFFNRYATYNGSDPYQAPGTLNVIPHIEHGLGLYFPQGGMHSITKALHQLACDMGVQFYFQNLAKEILIEKKKVTGVVASHNGRDETFMADVVFSNMDVVNTYQKLLPKIKMPSGLAQQPQSSSGIVFYWGIKKQFPELHLHNVFFGNNYRQEFIELFRKQSICEDPSIYLNITSKECLADAPEGCENWFVMINAPHNSGQDWDKLVAEARKNMLAKLSRMLQTDIEPLIVSEMAFDPRTIQQRYLSHSGSIYGPSSNNRFAAFLRHANFSSGVKNLYFCGVSVHPGGGIPLCLLSAKIATELTPKAV